MPLSEPGRAGVNKARSGLRVPADRETWEFQAPLLKATDPVVEDWDWFGYTVAISGDHIIVGAPKATSGGAKTPARLMCSSGADRAGCQWTNSNRLMPTPLSVSAKQLPSSTATRWSVIRVTTTSPLEVAQRICTNGWAPAG